MDYPPTDEQIAAVLTEVTRLARDGRMTEAMTMFSDACALVDERVKLGYTRVAELAEAMQRAFQPPSP